MSNVINSPNMNLPVPIVSVELGPAYATDVNQCLNTIDAHAHNTGSGVPITPLGLNINSDVTFQGNNATNVRTTRFSVQSSPLASASDVGAVYVAGVDLYYNDTAGNQIRMTSGGSIAGVTGSIANLVSPATATYNVIGKTFIWQSDVNTSAYMDSGPLLIRNISASSNAVTLQPPAVIANNYALTLPTIPANTSFLGIDGSGVIQSVASVSLGIKRTNMASVGQAISSSSGITVITSSGAVDSLSSVSALFVTLATSGRPVMVMLQGDGANAPNQLSFSGGSNGKGSIQIDRDGVRVTRVGLGGQLSGMGAFTTASASGGFSTNYPVTFTAGGIVNTFPPGSVCYLDVVNAGTHTYGISASCSSGNMNITNIVLAAYEL